MSLAAPLALLALLALPLLVWLHRRARPAGDQPFSAFFLVADAGAEGGQGRRLRAPLLLLVRALAVAALVVAAVGPSATSTRGTVVLTDGPLDADPAWDTPITWVRAGNPPTLSAHGAGVAPVDQPAWGAALLLAQREAPRARVVRARAPRPPRTVLGGGAAVIEAGQVRITATARGDAAPRLVVADQPPVALRPAAGEWALEGVIPAGGARIEQWPICVPDARPVRVADAGWPPAVERLLAVLPGVVRVPAGEADWYPGAGKGEATWAPFAPARVAFEFGVGTPAGTAAPLWFASDLPPPGAVARRWAALPAPADPILFAGDRVVVDHAQGPGGQVVRFGFDPADSDLVTTAGWPVLFDLLAQRTRAAAARCQTHPIGSAITVQSADAIRLQPPGDAPARTLASVDGRVVIDGLDVAGLYRLDASGATAWLAIQPALTRAPPAPTPTISAPPRAPAPLRWPWILAAAGLLVASTVLSRRARALWAWAAPLVALAPLALPPYGPPGAVAIAVDVSASMPAQTLDATLTVVRAALPEATRIDGDDDVTGVGAGPLRRGTGGTRHGPLLAAAAEVAGAGGVVVLLSDGRAPDGPVALDVPVVAVPVRAPAPDARVESANAVRIGEQVFVRAAFSADRPTQGTAWLGEVAVRLELGPEPRSVQAVLPGAAHAIEVRVEVDGDGVPANDVWPVPVADPQPRGAVAVGVGAVGWLEAAGLNAREVGAAGLAEAGSQLGLVRAMAIHDQPATRFAPRVLIGLMRWVSAGGVLVLAGRDAAFGPGGWAGSILDRLSPLGADPRPAAGRRLGLLLALDRSGSMAEEAGGIGPEAVGTLAARIAAGLDDDDLLGVLAFGMQAESLLAPTRIGALRAGTIPTPSLARGGTAVGPMIDSAVEALAAGQAERSVLMVITDGHVTDPEAADAAIARLRRAGVRLVAVLTGDDPALEPLGRIARATGGVAVRAERSAISRRALAGALMAAGDGLLAPGGPVQPRGAWGARVGGTPPPVGRRARVRLRDKARLLAAVDGEPLLAEWSIGQGRVIALATDRWDLAADQWAALLSPAAAPRPQSVSIRVAGDVLVYTADPQDPPPSGAAIIDGETAVAWRAVGPGRAVAPLPPGPAQILTVTSPTADGAVVTRVTRPPPAEVRRTGLDDAALALQARLTGGRVVAPTAVAPAVARLRGRRQSQPFTPWLLGFAVLLLVIEVARWAGLPMHFTGKTKRLSA